MVVWYIGDERYPALYSSGASIEEESSLPDLIGTSEIFTMEHIEKLCSVLPARTQCYKWQLAYSTSQHGFSLAYMYRKMQYVESPVLLVIQDTDDNVFGALTSCALRPSKHFYGTGESLLFSFQTHAAIEDKDAKDKATKDETEDQPAPFKHWNWTGANVYFILGSKDNISIGGGAGKFGLWLDGDLFLGRTQRCKTYGNEPLTTREEFTVKIMECWTFT